jgi:hypothetical protein
MVDIEFRLDDQDLDGLSNEHIQQRRRDYAQDLLDDKKFVFGKYSVSQNDIVCFSEASASLCYYHYLQVSKSRPYQGKIILRTLACAFKHVKHVRFDTSAPLPLSHYPKTLLAVATAAVR